MPPMKMRGVARPKNAKKTIFRLIKYMGQFKKLWPVVFVCVLVSSLAGVAGTYLLKPAINNYIVPLIGKQNPDMSGFAKLLVMMMFIYLAGVVASFGTQRILLSISTSTLCKRRTDLFHKMETLPLRYYDSKTHGELMSLFTNDSDSFRVMFSQSFPQLMLSVVSVTGVSTIMIRLS